MNVAGLAFRSLRQRALSTALTAFGVAVGVGLVVFVTTVRESSRTAFVDAARGYDVVVAGVRTTSLTSVLSTVFHVGSPVDTVPAAALAEIAKDERVLHAVPIAVGDVGPGGFRVVGTTREFFEVIPDATGRPLSERVAAGGRLFADPEAFEAVVGAFASSRSGLVMGSTFTVVHGSEDGHEHEEVWTVVGVLEPVGTPNDRAIFITLGSFFHVKGHVTAAPGTASPPAPPEHDHDHDHEGHDHAHEHEAPGNPVSAVIVRLKSPRMAFDFAQTWNGSAAQAPKRADVRASVPALEIRELFKIVHGVDGLLRAIAALVLIASAASVLAALYNSIHGRRREIAILRAVGARRAHVFSVVLVEAVVICLLGGLVGAALGHLGVAGAAPFLLKEFGVRIGAGPTDASLYPLLAGGLLLLGVLAGALPAWRAYRTPVARNLSAE